MLKFIDDFLNRITMYRLVLYYLLGLWLAAVILSFVGILPYHPLGVVFSAVFILAVCALTNSVFSEVFQAQTNIESFYITALILALIITPLQAANLGQQLWFFAWASVWAMASKYIFAIGKKHIFNPAAFAVALTALVLNQSASWWVGTGVMLPFVLLGGLLIVRKIRRSDLVISFLVVSLVTIIGFSLVRGANPLVTLERTFLNSALLFFMFVMLTEPLTTPPTKTWRITYGALVGFLFAPAIHLGAFYSTPELALLVGNVFSYLVSPKKKLILTLNGKTQFGHDINNFSFAPDQPLKFKPGQYLEWTLEHLHPDNRGNRRYFTIASSPTEADIQIGVKFYPESSSFKRKLESLNPGDAIVASQLAGEFILPENPAQKLVFIAGGIGITPFRSMLKYLLDKNEQRQITVFYASQIAEEFAYTDVLEQAARQLGIATVYTLTRPEKIPRNWPGERGPITKELISRYVPDFKDRYFYISGPHAMVTAYGKILSSLNIPKNHIKSDFFPGFV